MNDLVESRFYPNDDAHHTHDDDVLENDNLYSVSKTLLYKEACFTMLFKTLLLMNLKDKHGWSDRSFTNFLQYVFFCFPLTF